MQRDLLKLIQDTLGDGRRLFYFYPGYETVFLLQQLVHERPWRVSEVRQTPWGRLLDREPIRAALKGWSDGQITAQRLAMLCPPEPLVFRLTLSEWGHACRKACRWRQVSRPGYNLVLQLNMERRHNEAFTKLFDDNGEDWHPFKYYGHPTAVGENNTLAWARIDLSDDLSEALIEEIQNDWYREAQQEIKLAHRKGRNAQGEWKEWEEKTSRRGLDVVSLKHYFEHSLRPYGEVWAEAMLTATLDLLWKEIGVKRIFYHTYESGKRLKKCNPPRSIYTQLPHRCGFSPTTEWPSFLAHRRKEGVAGFWALAWPLGGQ